MDKKQFIDKWTNEFTDSVHEDKIEMEEDLDILFCQNSAKIQGEMERLKGEYIGTLQGIIAWNIAPELREKIMNIINKLEKE